MGDVHPMPMDGLCISYHEMDAIFTKKAKGMFFSSNFFRHADCKFLQANPVFLQKSHRCLIFFV